MNIIIVNDMKHIITVLFFCIPLLTFGQNINQNYIKEIQHLDGNGSILNINYFNGIGDIFETVTTSSGTQANIFSYKTYDSKGRERKVFNAVPGLDSNVYFMSQNDFVQNSNTFYNDVYAYEEKYYDESDRVTKEDIGGKLWHDNKKNTLYEYGTNTLNDKVHWYNSDLFDQELPMEIKPIKPNVDEYLYGKNIKKPAFLKFTSLSDFSSDKKNNLVPDTLTNDILQRLRIYKDKFKDFRALNTNSIWDVINNKYSLINYTPCSLIKEKTIDADGKYLIEFKDLDGNTILERRNQGDTYYVYNELGQLRYVLPPKYQETHNIEMYSYRYLYDERGNMIKKVLPGIIETQYWYDKENHLVLEQDPQLRSKGLYRFYIYDSLGRVVVSGTSSICNIETSNIEIRANYSQSSSGFMNTGYVFGLNILSKENATIEKVYYYDNYNFLKGCRQDDFKEIVPIVQNCSNGLVAGSIIRASNGEYIYTVFSYDPKGNVIACFRKGLNGYISKKTCKYSLTNKLKNSIVDVDVKYGNLMNISENNEYLQTNDMVGNKSIQLKHGDQESSTVIKYEYNYFNKLQSIIRPLKAGVVTYTYDDIKGWPISINSNSFVENLTYADGLGESYYNGNISTIKWKNNNYSKARGYKFYYDNLNRLTTANYSEGDAFTDALNNYDEIVNYDINGNITSLVRHGKKQDGIFGVVDSLKISLSGNQIQNVTDDAEENIYKGALDYNVPSSGISTYKYNDSGALISDDSRGIAMIEYDNYNNPLRIQFSNGNVTKYVYSAAGQKLRTIYYTAMPNITVETGSIHRLSDPEIQTTDTIDYLLDGKLILKNSRVDKYLFDEGYCQGHGSSKCIIKPMPPISWDFDDDLDTEISEEELEKYNERLEAWKNLLASENDKDEFAFYYYNKDHLGNIREVTDEMGDLSQVNNYYPFGTPFFDDISNSSNTQPFKYNGKELDLMHGLNTYDYGARQYYAVLPVWDRMDQLCEKNYGTSPYVYCGDNPIKHIDPDGKEKIDLLPPPSQDPKTYGLRSDIRHFNDDPNVINIWAHGNSNGIFFRGQKDPIKDAQSFSDMLKTVSKIWKNHKEGEIVTIVLHSCMTASFAEKISKDPIFKDVLIIAPNREVQVRNRVGKTIKRLNNNQTLNEATYIETGVSTDGHKTGSWMGYKDGKQYNEYDGSFKGKGELKPGTKGFDYRTFWDKLCSLF